MMIAEYAAATAALALALDLALGDPRSGSHPTAWMGALIARLAPAVAARHGRARLQRLGGALVVVLVAGAVVALLVALLAALHVGLASFLPGWPAVLGAAATVVGAALLKSTIAIRGMERHALAVVDSLERDGLDSARESLSMIVKRKTGDLDRDHVISGVLESVGESTVDGVTGPLFYYGALGLPGAFVYRAVNTADSMMGYRTPVFRDVGWFAATCDSVLNYLPARITGLVMVAAAAILRNDWRGSYRIMVRDGRKTPSLNAGYPMAALAGALGVSLEKVGHYRLGDGDGSGTDGGSRDTLTREHVRSAIRLMKLTSVLFCGLVTVPTIAAASSVGLWMLWW